MNILFLDNDEERYTQFQKLCPVPFTWVPDVNKCLAQLSNTNKKWDFIFLDHDLIDNFFSAPGDDGSGSEIARWMATWFKDKTIPIIIHSWNIDAAKYMYNILINAGFNDVHRLEFYTGKFMAFIAQRISHV